ncbi:MAG: nucleotidyltransferase family protein [Oscillatoria sp. PMC 1068.18]|nr:nucleotidyltransferase family protein [Oscillatoria sp. PMC 1076.18]MEC4990298.1 nucleotidyltransferase family protein [Oscillatoria sp. PMC 1068.18]
MILQLENKLNSAQTLPINNSLCPELQLILCCARSQITSPLASEIEILLNQDLDWVYLLQIAKQHNVLLLVYHNLQANYSSFIPPEILSQLQTYAQIKTVRQLFFTKELAEIIDLLAANKVTAVPFKGAVLAKLAYGNIGLRDFCDLDILVRRDDFLYAKDLLVRHGYRHKYFGDHEDAYCQAQLIREDRQLSIDLHYNITPKNFPFCLETESLWQGLKTLSLAEAEKKVSCLSPEDTVLVTYIQGKKENWNSLKRICDLAEIIQAYPQLNWTQIFTQVRNQDEETAFIFSLFLASFHLRKSLPSAIVAKSKNSATLQALAAEKYALIFSDLQSRNQVTRWGGIDLFRLAKIDNCWERIKYISGVAFQVNEKDKAVVSLPNFLMFLYYPIRGLRLVKNYSFSLTKVKILSQYFLGFTQKELAKKVR